MTFIAHAIMKFLFFQMLTPCHIPFLPVVVVILMAAPVWGALYPYGAAWGDQSPPNKRWEAYRMYFGGRQLVFMGVTTDQLRVGTVCIYGRDNRSVDGRYSLYLWA